MGTFKPSTYEIRNAIMEAARYQGGIYVGDNYVMKDHGDYIEVNVDANNAMGTSALMCILTPAAE